MKFVVQMESEGIPDTILDVDRSTSIGHIKTKLFNETGVEADDFKLFMFDSELQDSDTVDDVTLEDSNEVTVIFSMTPRGTFVKNMGETKWLLWGSKTSFYVKPIDQEEGIAITTQVFGIATSFEAVDGKKKFHALIYKANPSFMKMESKRVELRGKGRQTTVVKIKTDGTEKELVPSDTIEFDEGNNKPNPEEDENFLPPPIKEILKKAKMAMSAASGVLELIM